MKRNIVIMDFSGIYQEEQFYEGEQISWIDLSDISGTNCYCDGDAQAQILERMEKYPVSGIYFMDSGNYHYMSRIGIGRVKEPFNLLVFDNHTDMQLPAFGGLLSCGGWIASALEEVQKLQEDEDRLKEKLASVCETKNVLLEHLYHKPLLNVDELFAELMEYKKMVAPYVCDVSLYLNNALKEGKEILLEGQLGTLKDPDHGIYPMVTSSSTLAAYGAIGAGVPPYEIQKIVVVSKAYSSAVGAGAFVSEIFGEEADELRRRGGDGGEYGATTGRPRRMGWYDCVASKYGCRLQGATDVAFTVLDVLGYLDEIPVCVAYDIDGEITTDFPTTARLEKAKPVIEKLPGWKCDIRGIKNYEDLPENCRKYIEFIEEKIGYPITMVSNGPGRNDIIYRNK